ncbi:hypothetical protein U1Q18_051336 [Sarracenia purpurea var. burkii]
MGSCPIVHHQFRRPVEISNRVLGAEPVSKMARDAAAGGILLDDDADVSEEIKLTLAEKGGLVVLMTYAIQEAVTGFPPNIEQLM